MITSIIFTGTSSGRLRGAARQRRRTNRWPSFLSHGPGTCFTAVRAADSALQEVRRLSGSCRWSMQL
jgi:hypothetical protein